MAGLDDARHAGAEATTVDYGAIVVGAGFSGLRMLHELRGLGISTLVLEAGSDVGGTWYWNRYPGARTDSESWVYCFSFDEELQQEWDWNARFSAQGEVQQYLGHVADRFDMRRDIRFDARVATAAYDEDANAWTITTERGESFTCTYFIPATGYLSVAYEPPFAGLDDFQGEWYMTARWPRTPVDFAGKRVAVVGTGATAVQAIPEIARTAGHLTVFQRTANYVIPSRNHPLEDPQRRAIKDDYHTIWAQCRNQVFAFPIPRPYRKVGDVTPEEHQRILAAGWEAGGFRYIFETFDDVIVDPASNEAAAEFQRDMVRAIVTDPETAELLCAKGHPIGAKRIPLGHHYYETYNRDNVSLVSVADNPISRITSTGILLADGTEHEFDIIVFAIGFDAGTGALTNMDVRGTGGRSLKAEWQAGAKTYLGLAIEGYPNMLLVSGPHAPLANVPVLIEEQVTWVGRAIRHLRAVGCDRMEPTPAAMANWERRLQEQLDASLLTHADEVHSYYLGANIPGKAHGPLFYFGGASKYFREIGEVADRDFEGMAFTSAAGEPEVAALAAAGRTASPV